MPTARRLVPAFVVILLAVLGVGWLLTHPLAETVNGFDNDLARWLAQRRTASGNDLTAAGAFIGSTYVFAIGSLVMTGLLWWRSATRAPALFLALATTGVAVIYLVSTQVISRQRPPVHILDPGLVPDHSFPSGHTLFATGLYGGLAVLVWTHTRALRWLSGLLLLVPPVVAVSRLYEGAHHLTDVLTSLVAATAWVVTVSAAVLPGAGSRRR